MEPKHDPEFHTSGGDAYASSQGVPQDRHGKSLDAIREALLIAQGQRDPYPVDPAGVSADLSPELEQARSAARLDLAPLKDAVMAETREGKTFVMGDVPDEGIVCMVLPPTFGPRVNFDPSTRAHASADQGGPRVYVTREGEIVTVEAPEDN